MAALDASQHALSTRPRRWNFPSSVTDFLYRYGLFRQEIEHGHQKEYPDAWMELPYPFLATRREDKVLVRYRDMDVYAVPWDLPVTGWGTKNVNTIRLWEGGARGRVRLQSVQLTAIRRCRHHAQSSAGHLSRSLSE